MRENGIDVPDPGNGPQRIRVTGSPQAMQKAEEACHSLREAADAARPDLTPEQESEMRDQALAFARCLRGHGIDVPDPEVSGGRITMKAERGAGRRNANPESPAFRRAQEACEQVAPKPPDDPDS